jgi:hypothetical protein
MNARIGPALVKCTECGEEIPTTQKIRAGGKEARVHVPVRFCPKCRTSLTVPGRSRSRDQALLGGA